jgi:hypothetical protein
MSQVHKELREELFGLKGKSAWGLSRSYGSMFFLEIGQALRREGEQKVHGEWHFLIEMCYWRLDAPSEPLVGSDDVQELIDSSFADLNLGSIEVAEVSFPGHDLHILFSSGIRLNTFSAGAATEDEGTQWTLYTPREDVWMVDACNNLIHKSAYD